MTAIQPAQLKKRVDQLVNLLDNPNKFINELYKLFDVYGDKATRINQKRSAAPTLKNFNVPNPVLNEINQRIVDRYSANQQDLLEIAQRLWNEACLEAKILAIELMLRVTLMSPEISIAIIKEWALQTEDDYLMDRMAKIGLNLVISKKYNLIDKLAEDWLLSDQIKYKRLGVRMLALILDHQNYNNLPKLFFLISTFFRDYEEGLEDDLYYLLRNLITRSPKETTLFIKTNSSFGNNKQFRRIIRKVSKVVSDPEKKEIQTYLRNSMTKTY